MPELAAAQAALRTVFGFADFRPGQDVIVELDYDHPMTGQDRPATRLADRVAAAGGQLHQADNNGRQRLIAILPCE